VSLSASAPAGTVEYRTFPDSFVKVLSYSGATTTLDSGPDTFEVYDKNGNISEFTQQVLAQNGTVKSAWLRTSVTDRRGNGMKYQYGTLSDQQNNTQEYWPLSVTYSSHPSFSDSAQGADRSVTFAYNPPTSGNFPLWGMFDEHYGFEGGAARIRSHVLQTITMTGPSGTVRTYAFSYRKALGTSWPLLQSIQECAPGGTPGTCKQPTGFQWNDHPIPDPNSLVSLRKPAPVVVPGLIDPTDDGWYSTQTQMGQYLTTDVNGDGLEDLVTLTLDASLSFMTVYTSLNVGGDYAPFSKTTSMQVPFPNGWTPGPVTVAAPGDFTWKLQPMDYNQDGLMDIVLNSNAIVWGSMHYLRAKCTGAAPTPCSAASFDLVDTGMPTTQFATPWVENYKIADLNGDGVGDLVQCKDPTYPNASNPTWNVFLWSFNGPASGWQTQPIPMQTSQGPVGWSCRGLDALVPVADTDGDGRVELLIPTSLKASGTGDYPSYVYSSWQLSGAPATPGATPQFEVRVTNLELQDSSAIPPLFADINGDGHPDALFPYGWGWNNSFDTWTLPPEFYAEPDNANWLPGQDCSGPCTYNSAFTNDNVYVHLGSGDPARFLTPRGPLLANAYAAVYSQQSIPPWTTQFFEYAVPFDYNGDGQADLLIPVPGSCDNGATNNACWDVWFAPHNGVQVGNVAIPNGGVRHTFIPLDARYAINTIGNGAIPIRSPYLPHITDIDGDGRQDIVWFQKTASYPNPPAYQLNIYKFDTPQDQLVAIWDGHYIGDLNTLAPPTVSLTYANLTDTTLRPVAQTSPVPDSMADVFYNPHSNQNNGCVYPSRCVVGTQQVVSQYSLADGQGGARTYAMRYRDGRYDELGRGWLGFGEVVTLDITQEDHGHTGNATFFDNYSRKMVANGTVEVYPYAHQPYYFVSWAPGALSAPQPKQVEATFKNNTLAVAADDTGWSYFAYTQSSETKSVEGSFLSQDYSACTTVWDGNECYPRGYSDYVSGPSPGTGLWTGGTVLSDTITNVSTIDPFGNVADMSTSTVDVDLQTTTHNTYHNDPGTWYVGRLASSLDCSSTSTQAQQCKSMTVTGFTPYWEPQDLSLGDPSDLQTQLKTHVDRDAFGHSVLAKADDNYGNHRSSCTSYEATGIFPYATANSLSQISRVRVDLALGVAKASADIDGLVTQYQYDGFGRQTAVVAPDGVETTTTLAREKVGTWNATANALWYTTVGTATRTYASNVTIGAPTRTIFDGAGRKVHSEAGGPMVTTCGVSSCTPAPTFAEDYGYDTLGRLSMKTLSYLTIDPASAQQYVTYQYDNVNRVVVENAPLEPGTLIPWNTVKRTYNGNTTTIADTLGTRSTTYADPLGRPATVVDAMGGMLTYGYGPFGALLSIANSTDSTVRSVTRDALGRVKSSTDPDRGTSGPVVCGSSTSPPIAYDGFGDVTSFADANCRVFTMSYDSLGRLVKRGDPDGTTTWTYDTAIVTGGSPNQSGYALGRIASIQSPTGVSVSQVYDNMVRPSDTFLTVGSDTFKLSLAYDPSSGLPKTLTYPQPPGIAPLIVVYDRDSYGNLVGVHDQNLGTVYWSLAQLDGHGQTTLETFQNKVQRKTSYEPTTRRVSELQSGFGGGSWFQDLSYTYDPRLNLKNRSDGLQMQGSQTLHEHFYYDPLDRLTCSYVDYSSADSTSPACAWSMSYAGNGNITYKSDVGGYGYDPKHPHAVSTAGSQTYTYDSVGNQITRPDISSTIAYTAFDLPATYTRSSDKGIVTFAYDGNEKRVRKTDSTTNGTTETTYFGGIYERRHSSNITSDMHTFIVAAGSARMELVRQSGQPDQTRYVWPDVLGSTDVVTDAQGTVLPANTPSQQYSYDAFGQRRQRQGWTQGGTFTPVDNVYGFTGQEDEAGLTLVNMNGRIYDPQLGRFLQTDPHAGDLLSSQRSNPYSYVLNNPLKFVDPTGMDPEVPEPSTGGQPPKGTEVVVVRSDDGSLTAMKVIHRNADGSPDLGSQFGVNIWRNFDPNTPTVGDCKMGCYVTSAQVVANLREWADASMRSLEQAARDYAYSKLQAKYNDEYRIHLDAREQDEIAWRSTGNGGASTVGYAYAHRNDANNAGHTIGVEQVSTALGVAGLGRFGLVRLWAATATRGELYLASRGFYAAEGSAIGYSGAAIEGSAPAGSALSSRFWMQSPAQRYAAGGYQRMLNGFPEGQGTFNCDLCADFGAKSVPGATFVEMLPANRIGFYNSKGVGWRFHAGVETPEGPLIDFDQSAVYGGRFDWAEANAPNGDVFVRTRPPGAEWAEWLDP
jgi:RHS repeat-associated protein